MNALKKWLAEAGYELAADASEKDVQAVAQKAIGDGKLTLDKYAELIATKDGAKDKANELVKTIADSVSEANKQLIKDFFAAMREQPHSEKPPVDPDQIDRDAQEAAKKYFEGQKGKDGSTPEQVFGAAAKAGDPSIRVKRPSERYKNTKSTVNWAKGPSEGKPAFYFEGSMGSDDSPTMKGLETLSEAEYAKLGAVFAHQIKSQLGLSFEMPEHLKELAKESASEDRWVGMKGENRPYSRKLSDFESKAVLDGATSGGNEAVPEYFDFEAIRTPLLHGELFPFVQVVRVPRGSSADSYAIGTPTFVSTASGSAVTPFDTTGFVSAFDTTFFPATCAIEFGLDFIADAAPQFGMYVMEQINQEHLRWLDEQIAVGDGTTEPQGIFTASGNVVLPESSHTATTFTYDDVLNVAFGIDKAHRLNFGGNATRFVMSDAQYKYLMQIVTGVTGDARPIFGMNIKDYMLGQYPVSVQNNISEGNFALCNLRGYRMYQRQGLQFVMDETGRTSRLANTRLILARTRWGGKITKTSYIAELTA